MITHHSVIKESHEKLKPGEERVLTYKLFQNGKEIHSSEPFEALVMCCYRVGGDGAQIEPHAIGTEDGIFHILDNAGVYIQGIAKGTNILGRLIESTLKKVSKL